MSIYIIKYILHFENMFYSGNLIFFYYIPGDHHVWYGLVSNAVENSQSEEALLYYSRYLKEALFFLFFTEKVERK